MAKTLVEKNWNWYKRNFIEFHEEIQQYSKKLFKKYKCIELKVKSYKMSSVFSDNSCSKNFKNWKFQILSN